MITGITSTMHHPSIGAEPVIKPRWNSTGRSRGSYTMEKVVRGFLTGPVKRKLDHDYGQRWQVESVLPSFKRMLREYVYSLLRVGILNEALTKVYTYNAVEAHRNEPA